MIEVPREAAAARPRRHRGGLALLALMALMPSLLLSATVRCVGYSLLISFGDEEWRSAGLEGLQRNGAAGRRALLALAADEVRGQSRLRAFGGAILQLEPVRAGPLQRLLLDQALEIPAAFDELCCALEGGGDLQLLLLPLISAAVQAKPFFMKGVPVVFVERGLVYEIPWSEELSRFQRTEVMASALDPEALQGPDCPATDWPNARLERALLRRLRRATRTAPGEVRALLDSLHALGMPAVPLTIPDADFDASEIEGEGPFTVRTFCRLYEDAFGETASLSPGVRARLDTPIAGQSPGPQALLDATNTRSFEVETANVGGDPLAFGVSDKPTGDLIVSLNEDLVPEIWTLREAEVRWLEHARQILGEASESP